MTTASVRTGLVLTCAAAACTTGAVAQHTTPPPHRERIEWCDIWVPDANTTRLPAVLLVGDSICKGYYQYVAGALKGKAAVVRFATSASVADPAFTDQIDTLLRHYQFAAIHFNSGLHGWGYSEPQYAAALEKTVQHVRKLQPKARIVLVTSTPLRNGHELKKLRDTNARVVERNRIVTDLASRLHLPIDDLYTPVLGHPDWTRSDGTHFQAPGYEELSRHVTASVKDALARH